MNKKKGGKIISFRLTSDNEKLLRIAGFFKKTNDLNISKFINFAIKKTLNTNSKMFNYYDLNIKLYKSYIGDLNQQVSKLTEQIEAYAEKIKEYKIKKEVEQ